MPFIGNKTYALNAWAQSSQSISFDNNGTVLLVCFSFRSGTDIDSCTYDSVALTMLQKQRLGGGEGGGTEMWYLKKPAQGSNTLFWSAGGMGKCCCFIMSIIGAHLGAPIGDYDQTLSADANSLNRTLTAKTTSIGIGVSYAREMASHNFSWPAPSSEIYDVNAGSELDAGLGQRTDGAASLYMQVNYTNWSYMALAVAEIKASAGGSRGYVVMSKMREFFEDIKRGLISPDELHNRYRGLKEQGLLTI